MIFGGASFFVVVDGVWDLDIIKTTFRFPDSRYHGSRYLHCSSTTLVFIKSVYIHIAFAKSVLFMRGIRLYCPCFFLP